MPTVRIVDAVVADDEVSLLGVVEVVDDAPQFATAAIASHQLTLGGAIGFEPVSMCRHASETLVLGREGEIASFRASASGATHRVTPRPAEGPFRQFASDGRFLYALASDRQVFRADRPSGPWRAIGRPSDPAAILETSDDFESAFDKLLEDSAIWMALHIQADRDLVAVGTKGEAHIWNGSTWEGLAIPTNANFYAVTRSMSGQILLAAAGSLWEAGRQRCEPHCEGEVEGDVLSIVDHFGAVWLVSTAGVFEVGRDWAIATVALPSDLSRPFRLLASPRWLYLLCDHAVLRRGPTSPFETLWSDRLI